MIAQGGFDEAEAMRRRNLRGDGETGGTSGNFGSERVIQPTSFPRFRIVSPDEKRKEAAIEDDLGRVAAAKKKGDRLVFPARFVYILTMSSSTMIRAAKKASHGEGKRFKSVFERVAQKK